MKSTERLFEMAVKTAFYNMDFCPGTRFWEVMEQEVLGDIVADAQFFIDELGINAQPIDQYVVAEVLWEMEPNELDKGLAEWNEQLS